MIRRAAIALALAAVSSACMVARVDLDVGAGGTVDGTASVAYRFTFLERSRSSPANAQAALLADLTDDGVDGLECLPFRDAETIGAICTLTDVPLAELTQLDVFDRRIAIARVDDRIVLDSVIDLTDFSEDPATELDAEVTVTFAGPVIEQSGGSESGTTVSWTPRLGERLEAHAVAEAAPRAEFDEGMPLPIVAALVLAVAASVGTGVFLLARRR